MLRVLIYGDINLNIIDGSSVWLTSICHIFEGMNFCSLDLLLKCPPQKLQLINDISDIQNISLISASETSARNELVNKSRLSPGDAVKCIAALHEKNNYQLIVVRGFDVVKKLVKENFSNIVIPYITDFSHTGPACDKQNAQLISIYNAVGNMFVQTTETEEFLSNMLNVDGRKFQPLLPMIPDLEPNRPDFKVKTYSLAYIGKFAKDWHTEEILLAAQKVSRRMSYVSFNIAGNKFQQDLQQRQKWILEQLNENPCITWFGGVSRNKSQEIIKNSDIGISWRSSKIDNDASLELSTKLLEYGSAGKPVLLRRTKLHENLLGKDYEAFVESEDEFVETIGRLFNDSELYRRCGERTYERCKPYAFRERRRVLAPLFHSYGPDKKRILFAGHDLKFLKHASNYFDAHPGFEVKTDQWQGHNIHDEATSQELLNWADIVFCEWGLGNAVWYSNNKLRGQKLIIRMHGQERLTKFPLDFNFKNVDQIITVSPYMYELFHKSFGIPRNKIKIISNMIDTENLDRPKNQQETRFNLGIAGILPKLKQPHKAIEIIEHLYKKDKRYKLFIKSRKPEDLAWLMNRPDEKEYYLALEEKINNSPARKNIIFDPHGDDMAEWFQKVGYILSTSEFESFHLTPLEGMASGTVPVVLEWPGSRSVQDPQFIFNSVDQAVNYILDEKSQKLIGAMSIKAYALQKCGLETVLTQLEKVLKQEPVTYVC